MNLSGESVAELLHYYKIDPEDVYKRQVESRDTLKANTYYCGDNGIKIVSENNERYVL